LKISGRAFLFIGGVAGFLFVFSMAAWCRIQSVRWSYQAQTLRLETNRLEKEEEALDQKIFSALSLARLDELAKTKFSLQLPHPSQIHLQDEP
jgi:hypothetical protein